ncbi:MAG: sigma-54 dependent transcriptional regulator [Thioalkalivibrio sp.]|nr:sigma-54 dependent transcriptional regulator [Thioalkalivibrio sp.]
MSGTVLLVDDDPAILRALGRYLTGLGYDVLSEPLGLAGVESYERHRPDVVVLDLDLPDINGLDVLERLREREACVVMLTGTGDIETAVKSMRLGAENFLAKPVELSHLGAIVGRAAEKTRLRRENASLKARSGGSSGIDALGVSPLMTDLARRIGLLAESDRTTVLLTGESGTGKGWVAHLLHRMSKRADRPFVEVNCAGLNATFLDSELFGHEKGAYTDAKDKREGLFETAHTGLLFLDEVGDLAHELQPKLLKVLETKTFRRLGGTREISVDVRLVAATHQDLDQGVADGTFREDLFYRSRGGGFTPEPLRDVERRHIHRVLLHHDGNRTHAARDLGIARATLINKIKAYELDV